VIRAVSTDEILRFAHRTRPTTIVPPEWQPHLPMKGFQPPAPQPPIMRAGALGAHGQDAQLTPPPVDETAALAPPPPSPDAAEAGGAAQSAPA